MMQFSKNKSKAFDDIPAEMLDDDIAISSKPIELIDNRVRTKNILNKKSIYLFDN